MGDRISFGNVTNSNVAAGRHSTVYQSTGDQSAADEAGARAQLTALIAELRGGGDQESAALRQAENLEEAWDEGEEPSVVRRRWSKLHAALTGLTIAANVAQIGQFVQGLAT